MKIRKLLFCSAIALLLIAFQTSAQEAKKIEEIIVTAEKRAENVLEVPMTMTAFDENAIESLKIQSPVDLQNMVPGLQFGDNQEQVGQGTVIRGIGSRLAGETHSDLAVATYVDGSYTVGTWGIAPGGFFDLARVEVARGPQGTLNGRNSIAGSVSYYTKKPTQEWDVNLMTEFTDQSSQQYNAAFGGPLTENLSFRVTAGRQTGDGVQENVGGKDLGEPDSTFYAPQLRFQAGSFDMNLRWAHVEEKGTPRTQVALANVNRTDPQVPESPAPNAGMITNNYYLWATANPAIDNNCPVGVPGFKCGDLKNKVAVNAPMVADSESDLITFYATYDINEQYTVRYNYSDSDVYQFVTRDRDHTNREPSATDPLLSSDGMVPFEDARYRLPYIYEEESHELQLFSNFDGSFNFIVGLFQYKNMTHWEIDTDSYSNSYRYDHIDDVVAALGGEAQTCEEFIAAPFEMYGRYGKGNPLAAANEWWECPTGTDHTLNLIFATRAFSETEAVFFNTEYQLNENWLVSGGLRYTEDEKEQAYTGGVWVPPIYYFGVPLTLVYDNTAPDIQTWDQTIGHISIEYTSDDGYLVYGRVSTGYRAGGFNTSVFDVYPRVGEEELINYEVGLKGLFLDSRLQIAASLWYNDFDGYQLNATQEALAEFSDLSDTPLVEFTDNIDDTKIWGGDIEFIYQIDDNWRLSGFYAYQDSELGNHSSVVRGDPNPVYQSYSTLGDWTQDADGNWFQPEVVGYYENATDQSGNTLPMQPKHKLALTVGYDRPLGDLGTMSLLMTYSYTDEQYPDIANLSFNTIPSYDRWDASATWTSNDDAWSVTLFAQNLADEISVVEFIPVTTNGGGASMGTLSNPRRFGLSVNWRPSL